MANNHCCDEKLKASRIIIYLYIDTFRMKRAFHCICEKKLGEIILAMEPFGKPQRLHMQTYTSLETRTAERWCEQVTRLATCIALTLIRRRTSFRDIGPTSNQRWHGVRIFLGRHQRAAIVSCMIVKWPPATCEPT